MTDREQRAREFWHRSIDPTIEPLTMADFAESEVKRALREVVKGLRERADHNADALNIARSKAYEDAADELELKYQL